MFIQRKLYIWIPLLIGIFILSFYIKEPGIACTDGHFMAEHARNIALYGEYSFNKGEPDPGATPAPLWLLIVAFVHRLLKGDILLEMKVLGGIFLLLSAYLWMQIVAHLTRNHWATLGTGIAIVFDFFLIVYSIIGYGSALDLLILAGIAFYLVKYRFRNPVVTGLLFGLSILTRPNNFILLPLYFLILRERNLSFKNVLTVFSLSILTYLPYLIYCYTYTGQFFPPSGKIRLLINLPLYWNMTYTQFTHLGLIGRWEILIRTLGHIFLALKMSTPKIYLPFIIGGLVGIFSVLKVDKTFGIWQILYLIGMCLVYGIFFPSIRSRYFISSHPIFIVSSFCLLFLLLREKRFINTIMGTIVGGVFILNLGTFPHYYNRYTSLMKYVDNYLIIGEWISNHTPSDSRIAAVFVNAGPIKYVSKRYAFDFTVMVRDFKYLSEYFEDGRLSIEEMRECLLKKGADYIVVPYPHKEELTVQQLEGIHLVKKIEISPDLMPENGYQEYRIFKIDKNALKRENQEGARLEILDSVD